MKHQPLAPDQLFRTCDPAHIPFATTADFDRLREIIGQDRALEAIRFGVGIKQEGYNLYVAGAIGLGKRTVVERVIGDRASAAETPADWCYINNFDQVYKPLALRLPAGRASAFRERMRRLVKELVGGIPAAFNGEEYRARAREIQKQFEEQERKAFATLGDRAQERGIALIPTPSGYTLAPVRHGQPLASEEFEKLPDADKQRIGKDIEELKEELKKTIRRIPDWRKENAARIRSLNEEFAGRTVAQASQDLRQEFSEVPKIADYLDAIHKDAIEHFDDFLPKQEAPGQEVPEEQNAALQRYDVNVLVDNGDRQGAPIVYEANPTYQNLVGRVEHLAQFGTLITNFTLVQPGALHRANGGYLILDAHKVLANPFAWEALKRALRSGEIRIESLERVLSLVSTISLEPETIPLQVKLVLTGDRLLYYLLKEFDPEFGLLFKVVVDFAETFDWRDEDVQSYARLMATLAARHDLRPIDRTGVARMIEQSARMVTDTEKLSLHVGRITDLIMESDYWAGVSDNPTVTAEHVDRAIDAQIHRADQFRERTQEEIRRGTLRIDTTGERVAQINGISVIRLGDFSFGQPSRITATATLGEGEVLDIERETDLGGPLHSKGVLIISACLAHRYARNIPLSLSASLVFEQSYGMVEGDSASTAEFCVLLSALAELPLSQSFAVTGSIDQHGAVQAIGGVNEKIEGFFDVCRDRGLTGSQGVVIPQTNTVHLMLRREVVDAVARGRFHIHAVGSVDQVMEILTGLEAGTADAEGAYPRGTINDLVRKRLEELGRLRRDFDRKAGKAGEEDALS